MKLTAYEIKALKPKEKEYFIGDGGGLFVRILPSGAKFFVYQYISNGSKRRVSLGKYPEISLGDARIKRDEIKLNLLKGTDITKKEKGDTLGAVFDEWFAVKKNQVGAKQQSKILHAFRKYFLPKFHNKAMSGISRKEIITAINPLIINGNRASAKVALSAINMLYKYAVLHEYAPHNIIADIDKMVLLGKDKTKHHAFFSSADEVQNLLKAVKYCNSDERIKIAMILQLYTATRPSEARCAKWCEFDFDKNIWLIPAERMKMRKTHEIYISESLKEKLLNFKASYRLNSELLFPSFKTTQKPISDNAVRTMLLSCGYNSEIISPHGFRGTFATICNENISAHGLNNDIIQMCLAHEPQNSVAKAYNHATMKAYRAKLMAWWSDYLDALMPV